MRLAEFACRRVDPLAQNPSRRLYKDPLKSSDQISRLLFISQVYVPDPASVGQHMADVAAALVTRGYDVRVLTSARGYEDPSVKHPRRERISDVDVVRLPFSSFGKKSLAHRLLGQCLFLLQVLFRGVFARRLAGVVVSTSPPMAAVAAVIIAFVRRVPITYWVMDLNPDQTVALGRISARSPLVAAMRWLNRTIFCRAADVVVLDQYMAQRVQSQYRVTGRLHILPPWPHEVALPAPAAAANPFAARHNLAGRFVVMYSGNHSLASPVTTLLQAAVQMQDDPRLLFMFIGGGHGKREVDEAIAQDRAANIVSLPYQPLNELCYSLPAADLHVVTLGDNMVGMIHPCKIYGAMAVGRPILLIGPRPSHAADLIEVHNIGWQVDQGDIVGLVAALRQIVATPPQTLAEMGRRAREAVRQHFSKDVLCNAFCDAVEHSLVPAQPGHADHTDDSRRRAPQMATDSVVG